MPTRASRQRLKAAIAAVPKISCPELIDLGMMNLERESIVPRFLQCRADDMTLLEMIRAVKQRREAWIASLLDAAHRPLD